MDLSAFIMKFVVFIIALIGVAQSYKSRISYTRRMCSCNLRTLDGKLHMLVQPNTTYQAWPSVSCHKARKMCHQRCHQEIKIAIDAMHDKAGPMYKPNTVDGRRLGYDLCVQYGKATPENGLKVILRSEVEHCSTMDVDKRWSMQLCCGYSPSPENGAENLFGWYPKCPKKDTIVFA